LLFAAAGKNARLPKGIVLLIEVAREDDELGALPEGCDGVGRVILEEHDGRAVVEDKGDRPVVLAWLAWARDVVADPIRPNNLRLIGVVPSFLLTIAEAELRALKNATLLDGLLTSGVAALEGAGVLPLGEVGPSRDEGLVVPLSTLEDLDDAFVAVAGHEAAEDKVDGRGTGFPLNVRVDGVELLVAVAKLLVEAVPDVDGCIVVLVNTLLELTVGLSMGEITKHWSVGKCVRAAGADEHGRVATQRQGPRDGTTPTG
jgi:hypothetical protein